ncbi:MAG TPA: redox-sensing transcriptional repressor Rex [Firmicutes bacterium]|nr:redox-sensing transcriptional repressor Rex [Bacillota bacterium]
MPKVDVATVTRLPKYHQILQNMKQQGQKYASSGHLAQLLNVDPSLVRKDLACVATGVQKLGYPVHLTMEKIENLLGMRNTKEAFLAGAGSLGRALMAYPGFKQYGLRITAAFDADPAKAGDIVGGVQVLPIEKLADLMRRMSIMIGIIAVPVDTAQEVADLMIKAGALAIWNFAPITLQIPDNVIVRNENLAAGYALLSYELEQNLYRRGEIDEKYINEQTAGGATLSESK